MSQEQLEAERKSLDEEWAKLRAERAAFEADRRNSGIEYKLFVGNLDQSTEEGDIHSLFGSYGELKEVVMLKDREGKSKRSCFVKFYAKSSAEDSVNGLNGKHKDKNAEQLLVVRYARDKPAMGGGGMMGAGMMGGGGMQQQQQYGGYGGQSYGGMGATNYNGGFGGGSGGGSFGRGPAGANLYINNLSRAATEQDVQTMFGDFGTVVSVKIFSDQGYGFISFDNVQSAQNAISCLNGLAMGDGSKRLEVSVKKEKGAPATSRFSPY